MPVGEIAERHYRNGRQISRAAVAEVRRWWRRLERSNLDRSWNSLVGPQIISTVTLAQQRAAEQADSYLDAVLAEQDIDSEAAGEIAPEAFAGTASDGRPLDTLMYESVIAAKTAIGQGQHPSRAMQVGDASLSMITQTQVADAGRAADGVALAARNRVGGYVRQLTLPSCDRCAVLAGRWYRWNAGFARHPLGATV